jgi:uncharacterized RDD family membrane protein YckC
MADKCPLCSDESVLRRSRKRLYGHEVCTKCVNRFANRRQLAWILDVVLFRIAAFAAGIGLGLFLVAVHMDIEATLDTIYWPLLIGELAVFICKDGFNGYSPGKVICGVQVLDIETGVPVGFGVSFKRNLPTLIPFMPLVIAYQVIKGRRTGDKWARTKVIWNRYAGNPVFAVGPQAEQSPQAFAPAAQIEPVEETNNPYQAPRG